MNSFRQPSWCFWGPSLVAGCLVLSVSSALADDAECGDYARSAVEQNQQNTSLGCGYGGDRWTNDYQGHFNWCKHVGHISADSERQARADGLNACRTIKQQCTAYASSAVEQHEENLRLACGYTGDRWTTDYDGHYNWCAQVGESSTRSERQARAEGLRLCRQRIANVRPPVVDSMPADCLDLRRHLNSKLSELGNNKREYDGWQNKFNDFFRDSMVKMCTAYKSPTIDHPFINPLARIAVGQDIHMPVSVTGGVEYEPKIQFTFPNRSNALEILSAVSQLSKQIKSVPFASAIVSALSAGLRKVTPDSKYDYEEGIQLHRQLTEDRKKTLAAFSRMMSAFYCEKILPLQEEVLQIRDRGLNQSDCNAMERQVLISDVTRGSDILNEVHLNQAKNYCQSL